MPVKKRRTSPSAASSASSTPAPPSNPPSSSFPSNVAEPPTEGLAGPGPSTQSRRERNDAAERRQYARLGVQVPGSGDGDGDGDEYGEECFLWADVPIVKNFRYSPCAISPTPSPHPRFPFHRTIPYPPSIPPVHISWIDRSSYLRISPSGLTISNDKGFRSARANVSVREGMWYFEVKVERGNGSNGGGKGHLNLGDSGNPHIRIGWGRREANIDSPVGSDGYSYAIRDVGCQKVHLSRPKPYGINDDGEGVSFKSGDIIGCLINLPKRSSPNNLPKNDPGRIKRQRRQFIYKGQSYFESPEYLPSKEMDSLVDREGKLLAERKAAEKALADGVVDNDDSNIDGGGSGNGSGKQNGAGGGKKGATTKNTKKKKQDHNVIANEPPVPVSRPLKRLEGSSIEFYLNGKSLGIAFQDLYDFIPLKPTTTMMGGGKKDMVGEDEITHDDGTLGYYPMISCFGKGKATFNPGPNFIHSPKTISTPRTISKDNGNNENAGENEKDGEDELQVDKIRPICERYEEFRIEEREYDERDEREGTIRLKELLEEEEKYRIKSNLQGNSGKRKKGASSSTMGKKKKMDITEDIKGGSGSANQSRSNSRGTTPISRGNTMTPAPEQYHDGNHEEHDLHQDNENESVFGRDTSTPGLEDSISIKDETQDTGRDRSISAVPPSTNNSVSHTRASSPISSNIIYQEIADQSMVIEDTPKSPVPVPVSLDHNNISESVVDMDVDVREPSTKDNDQQGKQDGYEGKKDTNGEDDEEDQHQGVKW